jgi:hypothetical protein
MDGCLIMAEPTKADDLVVEGVDRFQRAYDADKANKALAYEALHFMAGDQWPETIKQDREATGRLCLVVNKCPAFVAQVANDIRMGAPAVLVIATGGIAENEPNKKRAEALAKKAAGIRQTLIRHVEVRSDAQSIAYSKAAGDQVACGYGAWRVRTEYASTTSLTQELRIDPISDPIGVIWDPDSYLPTREDANFCFVPVDISRTEFKSRYPDAAISELGDNAPEYATGIWGEWNSADTVRITEYWYKKKEKKGFVSPDGSRLIPADDPDAKALIKAGNEIKMRDTICVYRAVISATDVLEPAKKWPGSLIPIVPVFGQEIQIGRERRRYGIIEHMKDAQRRLNFFVSAQAEIVALQPKAPFIGTDKHFEGYEEQWSKANSANYPYLMYNHDPQAPGGPQRSQPPVSSQGIAEGIALASQEMKEVTGIYDAALGQRSNETSGVAINARKRESDVGSYEYSQNFSRALRHTGRILIDLIPRIYDTERVFRVMGEDGKIDTIKINQVASVDDVEDVEAAMMINDVSAGEYDVVLDVGPSFTTRRDEAREAMLSFAQSYPPFMQLAGDVVAKASNLPETVVKRLRASIPPELIAAEEAGEEGEGQQQPQQGPQIPPEMIQQIQQETAQQVMQGPEFAWQALSTTQQCAMRLLGRLTTIPTRSRLC